MVSDLDSYFSNHYQGLHWQMTSCEKFAIQHILNHIRPAFAIEVGTYQGGSLQALSSFSGFVDSIDIDPNVSNSLKHRFSNVNFYTGNSTDYITGLLEKHNEVNQPVEFILIDGDHSTEGGRNDIEAILRVPPQKQITVLMHDSFNPDCRAGILSAGWEYCPYVHEVEVDFIPGVYHEHASDTALPRTMWGGFACAVLKPEKRTGNLLISERQKGLFNAVLRSSVYSDRFLFVKKLLGSVRSKYINSRK